MAKDEGTDVLSLLRSAEQSLYGNGFSLMAGNADVCLILQQNGKPVAAVNMSFTLAKTLAKKLGGLIEQIENNTNHTIMVTDEVFPREQPKED